MKCQPKSKLLRRQKSASEVDTRGLDIEDESKLKEESHVFQLHTRPPGAIEYKAVTKD